MTENIEVTEVTATNRILICTESHSDCVAVACEDIEDVIEDLEQYVPEERTFADRVEFVEQVYINDRCYDFGGVTHIERDRDVELNHSKGAIVGPVEVTIASKSVTVTAKFREQPEIEFSDDDTVLELTGETV